MIIFNTNELLGSFILFLLAAIGRTAGLGGSVFAISIFLLLFNFNLYYSIGYTQISIFTGVLTSMTLKFKTRSPLGDKPLIEFDTLMQVITPIILGISLGSHIIPMFPLWLLSVIFILFNLALCIYVLFKIKFYYINTKVAPESGIEKINMNQMNEINRIFKFVNSEQAKFGQVLTKHCEKDKNNEISEENFEEPRNNIIEDKENLKSKSNDDNENIEIETGNEKVSEEFMQAANKLQYFLDENKKIISKYQLIYYTSVFIISIFLSNIYLSPSIVGVSGCSDGYAYLLSIYGILILIINALTSFYLVGKTKIYQAVSYKFQITDISWTYYLCLKVWIFSLISGFILGFLGMSAGYIINPMLLYFNLPPVVSSFSTAFSIFYTSSIPTFQFIISGNLDYRYCIWITIISILGSLVGSFGLRPWILQRKKFYFLLVILEFILLISLGSIFAIQIYKLINTSFVLDFDSLCGN
ncbi:hypothetical protein SteCoe_29638 [Stentor coeruleus]|uniref:Uncharacterized protein n=1 Tax=Stentor coeruleus TaxID=5963 RepID=A0A1R2B5S7_9CILI|nr:hypothetical protein SteCoe_29638 [Stentor coeruleus]